MMIELLERHGGRLDAGAVGCYRLTDRAKEMLADATGARLPGPAQMVAEQLLSGAACGGDPEIVRLALEHVDWPRDDRRWFSILEQPLRIWNHGARFWANTEWDRTTYLTCFRLVLARCDPNLHGRETDVAFATMLLDAGAKLDVRDYVLESTPLGCGAR